MLQERMGHIVRCERKRKCVASRDMQRPYLQDNPDPTLPFVMPALTHPNRPSVRYRGAAQMSSPGAIIKSPSIKTI